jgi:putative ABC transport system permease protein
MRSALTVLGVVIGITSIVGMTSLIRGFDNSLREAIGQLGPNTIMIQKWGAISFASGKSFLEVARRPNLSREDALAIERECPSVAMIDVWLGIYGNSQSRIYYGREKTKSVGIIGATENWAAVNSAKVEMGRLFTSAEVEHRRQVTVLGRNPWESLFPNVDPIGKTVRIGANEFTVVGVLGKRPSPGGFSSGADDFAVIPFSTHEKFFGKVLKGSAKISASSFNPAVFRTAMIAVVPHEGMREEAMREVEALMRIRHKLNLEQPNDFDIVTQDAVLKVWDQISRATFLALVVISSIALMVGGIGVMAIMMISVTERTREIGVRKALGATRREIMFQFLVEAATLTLIGCIIGIATGALIALGIRSFSPIPATVPLLSVVAAVAASILTGVLFGIYPASKASRLDPVEPLRYE